MRAASIDIGTNTTLALLAESAEDGLRTVKDQHTVNHLGEALKDGHRLPPDMIALNVDLLNEIVRDYRRDGAEDFVLCGTSALRRAQNREEFITAVHDILGLAVEILPGHEEAALTYLGAVSNRDILPHERVRVIDLGGGSTEIVEGSGLVPGARFSLDMGASYLTGEFFHNDPPSPTETSRLREHLSRQLPDRVKTLRGPGAPWVLVGGTAVTLAILKSGLRSYNPAAIGGTLLSLEDIEKSIASFAGKSSPELQLLPGMPAGRGRVIRAGAILLAEMFRALNITEGIVSERGLRHGLWLARFGKKGRGERE